MKLARLSRFAQLGAVALALIFVLAAGGYGITRGLQSNLPHAATTCHGSSAGWLPVINKVTLPTKLPEGVSLATTCYSTGLVTLFYSNEQRDKTVLVVIFNIDFHDLGTPLSGAPVGLGTLTGYVRDETKPEGRSFFIRFDKRGWEYDVGEYLGKNPGRPDNKVTIDELNAVALSIAQR